MAYIISFAVVHRIYMVGFGISTLFMLGIELYVYFRERASRKKRGSLLNKENKR
jgi:hypothetical protein